MALSCALCTSTLTPHPPPRIPLPSFGDPSFGAGKENAIHPPPGPTTAQLWGSAPHPKPRTPPRPHRRKQSVGAQRRGPTEPQTPPALRGPPIPAALWGGSQPPMPPPIPPPPNGTCTALGPSVARSHVGVWQRCGERSCQAGKADGAPLWGGGGSVGLSGGTWDRSHLNGPIRDGSQRSHCRSRKPQSSRERPQGLHGGRSCSAPHPRPAAHAVAMGAEPGGGPVTAGGGHCGPPTVGVRSLSGAVRRRSSLIESYL